MLVVGICSFDLLLHEGASLKEKRMIVQSLMKRVSSRYNVSVAEIDKQDKWQIAGIGFSCVGNDRRHVERMLQEILRFIEADGRGEVMNIEREMIT
ncbi:DUF503 domain-containing protein [Anoxynatronum buryatiense]|uniref:DUF503 domain-containing protein n=1 Tax=Anoxynatronum buryatiense TaxID=489973 RepID=A0AA45WSR4_9CLOT|nr:DUF503 domain-containing protein [Anoxynatronum buryatiense]SMP39169.1 hypothetical protein SAMN06296020_101195 [Anoxynatronum buryatiense]